MDEIDADRELPDCIKGGINFGGVSSGLGEIFGSIQPDGGFCTGDDAFIVKNGFFGSELDDDKSGVENEPKKEEIVENMGEGDLGMDFNSFLGFVSQDESNFKTLGNVNEDFPSKKIFSKYKADWSKEKYEIPAKIQAESQIDNFIEKWVDESGSLILDSPEPEMTLYHKIHGNNKQGILQSEALEDEEDQNIRNPDQFMVKNFLLEFLVKNVFFRSITEFPLETRK